MSPENLSNHDANEVVRKIFRRGREVFLITISDKEKTVSRYKSGSEPHYCANIESIDDKDPILLLDEIKRVVEDRPKRRYVKKTDRADPSKSAMHDVNRSTSLLRARISPEYAELFKRCADAMGQNKRAAERAIALLAEELDLDPK